jgi:hypothetical protein
MRFLFRPSLLILLSVVLALGATALVLWPRGNETRAVPLRDNEHEIVWLNSAVNASAWERFHAAVLGAAKDLKLEVVDNAAFPRETTVIPEIIVTVRDDQKLIFRWYKLTNDQRTEAWVQALLDRSRPPLAIIGGSSSDSARDLALSLRNQIAKRGLRSGPQLLLTTATADHVSVPDGAEISLHDLYPGRTFRFCSTNQQMARAVTEFVASQEELRPDAAPVYVAQWEDDAYSKDLTARFCESLNAALDARGPAQFPVSSRIDYSVGGFDEPNRWEGPAIKALLDTKIQQNPGQRRPVLVLSAPTTQPARRFLRGLASAAPAEARRFVVVTGDALPFNTVYRDREVSWRVQDLPFDLVFFCHRNPVSYAAGFPAEPSPSSPDLPVLAARSVSSLALPTFGSAMTQLVTVKQFQVALDMAPSVETAARSGTATTGTEDLLLFMDIVESLVQSVSKGDTMPADGDELGERLLQLRWQEGRVSFNETFPLLFDANGNRRGASGEHIVWLHPLIEGERVQPHSIIRIFGWRSSHGVATQRERVLVRTLVVDYE